MPSDSHQGLRSATPGLAQPANAAARARKRRTCASRSSRRCSSRSRSAAPCSSALVSGTTPGIGAISAAASVGHGGVQLGGRDGRGGQADRDGLVGRHDAGGGADLQRPGVADVLDQRLGAGEVGDQAERRLLHGELRVVGDHAEVAGQGELEAGADGVAAHLGDRDESRVAQPREAALELLDPRRGVLVAEREQADDALLAGRRRVEHRAVEPGGEGLPLPRHDDDPDVVRQGPADLAERQPHGGRLCVADVGPVQRHRRHRPLDLEAEADGGEVFGSHATDVTTA